MNLQEAYTIRPRDIVKCIKDTHLSIQCHTGKQFVVKDLYGDLSSYPTFLCYSLDFAQSLFFSIKDVEYTGYRMNKIIFWIKEKFYGWTKTW